MNDQFGWVETSRQLLSLVEKYSAYISEGNYQRIAEFDIQNEYGVAFEFLCDLLDELEVKISEFEFEHFKRLASRMGYQENFIEYYRKALVTQI